jgi:chromosome segregation ATPase
MEAHSKRGQRFARESGGPRLAEAPAPLDDAVAADPAQVLDRLEHYVEEAGRLRGRLDAIEEELERERKARRRLIDTLKLERRLARGLKERADRAEDARDTAVAELEQTRERATAAEQQLRLSWSRVAELESTLAWKQRPLWRKLLRRAPEA